MAKLAQLNLRVPKGGLPGVTPALFRAFLEAARVILSDLGYRTGTILTVDGLQSLQYCLKFRAATEQQRRSYSDPKETTEWAACGIAFLIIPSITSFTVVERSFIGTTVDYWLGHSNDPLFQNKARLEVSGIRRGNESEIKSRVSEKLRRSAKIPNSLPLYVSVTEFGTPCSCLVKK